MNTKFNKDIRRIMENEIKPQVMKDVLAKRIVNSLKEQKQNNSFPGKTVTDKALKMSERENNEALKMVSDKINDYLDFEYNSHPQYPHQNNSKTDYTSPMYRNSSEEEEYIEDWRGMGLGDVRFDTKPTDFYVDRVMDYIKGSSKTGNDTDYANAIESNLGNQLVDKIERKGRKLDSDEWSEAIPNLYQDRKANRGYTI